MQASFHLQDVTHAHRADPRHFLIPSAEEIDRLQTGELVRLFFVLDFDTSDGCRAERMWVKITGREGDQFHGYLTNKPAYINDLQPGDTIYFHRNNIASILIKVPFDENKKAIITLRALQNREINWLFRDKPHNEQDCGWQFFYGDEDNTYLNDHRNAVILPLNKILEMEPRLEKAMASGHQAFEWDEEAMDYTAVKDWQTPS
ncbi:immunity protein Imm33 domain-containing protein [Chitinophaga varians]|uniref:immunity protein Imm33 domain-containing protein n=1 Tax=Chitinophaga varians TaxID=2202339 RepID=UPI00165EF2F2|nr:DUF2185 domain-containing protein [Chitinophaga varians]MBC9914394.1 DUF2185 domain-containing protein [Chitinophaga varians]